MTTYGEARLAKGEWKITAEAHVMMRIKRVFGRSGGKTPRTITVKDTLDVCRDLAWICERWPLDVKPADHLERRAAQHRQRAEDFAALILGKIAPRAFDLAVPARPYQSLAAEAILRRGALLLADDLGLGKTASAICALTDPSTRPALVTTLTHLPGQWKREINRFAPGLKVHILKKATPYPLGFEKGTQTALLDETPDVIITNYHKLAGWADHLAGHIKTVVFDECQELRSGHGKETPAKYSAACAISHAATYRMGLSATPIYNYGSEFYSVISVLDPEALGTRNEFLTEWCTGSDEKAKITDPAAFGLWLREQGLMLRRTRSDVGRELPPISTILQPVDADLSLLDKVQTSAMQLARSILAVGGRGFDKMRDAGEFDMLIRRETGVAKAPHVAAFVRMLVESGERVVLFGWHHEVYRIWAEQLREAGVVFYTGRETPAAKAESLAKFMSGDAKVIVLSLRAGAGLDGLQKVSRTCVFGELDWSPGVMEQCKGRVGRDGQEHAVFAYVLVADVGSDPVVADVLGLKGAQLEHAINPNADRVVLREVDPDHIKKLALEYLKQLGEKAPAAPAASAGAAA